MVPSIVSTHESSFKAFVKRRRLLAMCALVFALAWPGMILEAMYSQGLFAIRLPVFVSILIGWAPGIAAVVMSAIGLGRTGVYALLRRSDLARWD